MSTTMKEKPEKIYPQIIGGPLVAFNWEGDKENGPMLYLNGLAYDEKQLKWMERAVKKVLKWPKRDIKAYNLAILQERYYDYGVPLKEVINEAHELGIEFVLIPGKKTIYEK